MNTNTEAQTGYIIEVTDLRRGDGFLHSIKKAKNGRVTFLVAPDRSAARVFADEILALKWAAKMAREIDAIDVEVVAR